MTRVALSFLLIAVAACGGSEQSQPTRQPSAPAAQLEGKALEGQKIVMNYGCNVCHTIPGTDGPQGTLGPSLAGVGSRPTISFGKVENSPDNLAQFVQNPASVHPQSSMPPTGLSDAESEAVAAFLMTLK
jgi:cytochrome c2